MLHPLRAGAPLAAAALLLSPAAASAASGGATLALTPAPAPAALLTPLHPFAPSAPATASAASLTALRAARARAGDAYMSGGTHPGGFDCSGLVQWAFRQAGVSLPRTSYSQYGKGTPVARADIRAGDLVFFNSAGGGASHVGIAVSRTSAVSATNHGVMVHSMRDAYWGSHYVGARRLAR